MLKKIYYKIKHFAECMGYYGYRYLSNKSTPLWALAAFYKLDKAMSSGFHNYISIYESYFSKIKKNVNVLVEIGIGVTESGQMAHMKDYGYRTGNSLRCWRDYFPNAQIIGIDIYQVDIHEERITTYVGDQTREQSMKNIFELLDKKIDIIIDDGTHEYIDQINNFVWLHVYLNEKGLYIIEDVDHEVVSKFISLEGISAGLKIEIEKKYNLRIVKENTKKYNCMVIFEKIN